MKANHLPWLAVLGLLASSAGCGNSAGPPSVARLLEDKPPRRTILKGGIPESRYIRRER